MMMIMMLGSLLVFLLGTAYTLHLSRKLTQDLRESLADRDLTVRRLIDRLTTTGLAQTDPMVARILAGMPPSVREEAVAAKKQEGVGRPKPGGVSHTDGKPPEGAEPKKVVEVHHVG